MFRLTTVLFLILPIALGQTALTTAQIAKKVSPSVVVIQGETDNGDVLGSGFIVSKDGKIVTNLHVIRDMTTASVHIPNRAIGRGWSIEGKVFSSVFVLATDETKDLAIIKVAGVDLPVLGLGNSDTLTVGEQVVVVGSPLGLDATVTAGILSAIRGSGEGYTVLQTDAAVNHGNSGGPLVSATGLAIGVISSILRSDSAQGLNFAIPVNYVRGLLNSLHEPQTFEQMRRSLVGPPPAPQQGSRASLKETLDWLKEKIPLAVSSYAYSFADPTGVRLTHVVSDSGIVMSLASCTAVVGFVQLETQPQNPDTAPDVSRFTNLYVIPLGALTEWFVSRQENDAAFVSGDRWSYVVFLRSTSPNLSATTTTDTFSAGSLLPPSPPKTERRSGAALWFNDEPLARQVAEAFHHASDLCRKEEVF